MKPYFINGVNAVVLIILGSWAYLGSDSPSPTALIPVFGGLILLILTPSFKKGNRVVAHIAVTLTLILLIGLIKPLTGAIGRNDFLGIARVIIMMLSSAAAMFYFIRSFVEARKNPSN
ncbi:MAG: hypothetical protein H6540_09675 [Bacteroidales bacterium]|nr:hypothetical protein [Bacteroidales bacterium]MCB9000313.1 hypothetical protein [Bacteroidales bacterium]